MSKKKYFVPSQMTILTTIGGTGDVGGDLPTSGNHSTIGAIGDIIEDDSSWILPDGMSVGSNGEDVVIPGEDSDAAYDWVSES